MPGIQDQVDEARRAGYTDAQIGERLIASPSGKEALAAGHSAQDIFGHFGLQVAAPGTVVNPPATQSLTAGPQDSSLLRLPRMGVSAMVKGVGTTIGLPGTLAELGTDYLVNPAREALGLGSVESPPLPTIGQVHEYTGRLGLTDRADLVPGWGANPVTERMMAKTSEGLGSSAPLALTGAPVATLATGALGGAAAGAIHELAPALGVAGEMAAGGLAGGGALAIERKLASTTPARIASKLGTSETLQDAGGHVQDAAREWLATTKPRLKAALEDPVNAAVPSTALVDTRNFEDALARVTKAGGTLPPSAKRIWDRIQNDQSGISDWTDVKDLWKAIGDAKSNPAQVARDLHESQLDHLYSGLAQDRMAVAQAHGAGDKFTEMLEGLRNLHDTERSLGRVIKTQTESSSDLAPGDVAKALLRRGVNDGSELTRLRELDPKATDELSAALLRTAPRQWHKLSPEAKVALVPDPAQRAALEANIPGTGRTSGEHRLLQSIVTEPLGRAVSTGLRAMGAPDPLAGMIGDILGIGIPSTLRAGRTVVKNPRLPAVGLEAGTSGLWPHPALAGPQPEGTQP